MTLASQTNQEDEYSINLLEIENDGKRVEVQRYFGYEDLFSRYLTLPYDVSANTSNQGRYFDIGYVIFALLPIALLLLFYRNKRLFYAIAVFQLFYLAFVFNYSFLNISNYGPVSAQANDWDKLVHVDDNTFAEEFMVNVYDIARIVSKPLLHSIKSFSGQSDHVTYAILFLIFSLTVLLIKQKFRTAKKWMTLSLVITAFGFLWLILSGGIIWYGFLIIPIAYAFIFRITKGLNKEFAFSQKIVSGILLFCLVPWIMLAYANRVSNIGTNQADKASLGTMIAHPQLSYYSAGLQSAIDSRNLLYRNNTGIFEQLNSNNDLIYQVGTSITFEIKNNTERIYHDNTLTIFFTLLNLYREKEVVIEAFKAAGFRYIIIDLFTHTLDKTPEQSLVKKYQLLLNTIYQNNSVKLLATDRVVQVNSTDGVIRYFSDVFGQTLSPADKISMKEFGSYAIYEIL